MWAAGVVAPQELGDEASDLRAAEVAHGAQEWREAIQAFEAFIEAFPESELLPHAYLRLGQSHTRLEEDAKARQAYADAIKVDPDDTYASQSVSYWGNVYAQRYQYREAAQMCREVARLYPGSRSAEMAGYLLGTYLRSGSRPEEAASAYRAFIDAYPGSVYRRSALQQLVAVLVELDRTDEAERLVTEHLNETPNDAQLIRQLAGVYDKQSRHGDAVRLLQAALVQRPGDIALLEALGEAHAAAGDEATAKATWMTMVQTSADSYSTRQRLGTLLKRHGFYDDAATQFEAAIRFQPSLAYLYTQLGEIHRIRGDVAAALGVYAEALAALGTSVNEHKSILSIIESLYPAARQQEAFKQAAEAMAPYLSSERNPSVLLALAELHVLQGDLGQALHWFRELGDVHPDNGDSMTHYARYLGGMGDHEGAIALYQGALDTFPDALAQPQWLVAMGGHLAELGRAREAAAAYRRALELDPGRRVVGDADVALVRVLVRGTYEPEAAVAHIDSLRSLPRGRRSSQNLDLLASEAFTVLGRHDEARQVLSNGRWLDPEARATAAFLAGEIMLREGDYDGAEQEYLGLARSDPFTDVANDALARLALIRASRGQPPDALGAYVSALTARSRGDVAGAMTQCRAAIDSAPSAPLANDAHLLAAELALETGDHEYAVEAYRSVAETGSGRAASALLRLADIYRDREEVESAVRAYEELLERFPATAFAIEGRRGLREVIDGDSEGNP